MHESATISDVWEDFALASDRAVVVDGLVPGTEDAFYLRCLHLQHVGQLDEAAPILDRWQERFPHSDRLETMRRRQLLLTAGDDPEAAFARGQELLDLTFSHTRDAEAEEAEETPSALDPAAIDADRLVREGIERRSDLSELTDHALFHLADRPHPSETRRALLDRIDRPDAPGLLDRIVEDLDGAGEKDGAAARGRSARSRGGRRPSPGRDFGSRPIDRHLLLPQLEELQRRRPDLAQSAPFCEAVLHRLQPPLHVDQERDRAARRAYLDRVCAFADTIAPSFHSLKARVLYHLLALDQVEGTTDRERLLAYLELPIRRSYTSAGFLDRLDVRQLMGESGPDVSSATALQPIDDDEPVVRHHLAALLSDGASVGKLAAYVDRDYLRRLQAETMLTSAGADTDRWVEVLGGPAAYQALEMRVDLDLAPGNPEIFRPEDPVSLDVYVKNVDALLVKVFEIRAGAALEASGREIGLDLDLDGFAPNVERTLRFDAPKRLRCLRTIDLPELAGAGVFMVELVGGGKASRALIRKGTLHAAERIGAGGHVFTVFDEDGRPVRDASLWLQGLRYPADEGGEIAVPFTRKPGFRVAVVRSGARAALVRFRHQAESASLEIGVHLERESLLGGWQATALVRPVLRIAGRLASLELLEEPTLVVTAVDLAGDEARSEARVVLEEGQELVHRFRVPAALQEVRIELRGRVRKVSEPGFFDLECDRSVSVNADARTADILSIELARSDGRYVVRVQDRTGDPLPRRGAICTLAHRDVTREVEVRLRTDAHGEIDLGPLEGVERVSVRVAGAAPPRAEGPAPEKANLVVFEPRRSWVTRRFSLERGGAAYPETIHVAEGEPIRLPLAEARTAVSSEWASLFELRGGTSVRDRFDALAIEDGALCVRGLEAGEYTLSLHDAGARVAIRVAPALSGEAAGGDDDDAGLPASTWLRSGRRLLEAGHTDLARLVSATRTEDAVEIRVDGGSESLRVHVLATRFAPGGTPDETLGTLDRADPLGQTGAGGASSAYTSGRELGDEARYVLDRRRHARRPGVMLARPGLLLEPWAVRRTTTGRQEARTGEAWAASPAPAPCMKVAAEARCELDAGLDGGLPSIDYLARGAVCLANLRPGPDGRLSVPLDRLKGATLARVMCVDEGGTQWREVSLSAVSGGTRDLTSRASLNPETHRHTERRAEARDPSVASGESESDPGGRSTTYRSLARVVELWETLEADAELQKLRFLWEWPTLDPETRRLRLSEHPCHEVHLFLSRKDPAFFDGVCRPHLENRLEKTFFDRYLLGEDLARYLEPWAYGRLNLVERILLAERLGGEEPARLLRELQHADELKPEDLAGRAARFRAALSLGRMSEEAEEEFARLAEADAELAADMEGVALGYASECEEVDDLMETGGAGAAPPSPRRRSKKKRKGRPRAKRDARRRGQARPPVRTEQKTWEWCESRYYRRERSNAGPDLIPLHRFWLDLARHRAERPGTPFVSPHFPDAGGTTTERLLALAFLDLGFAEPSGEAAEGGGAPSVVFREAIVPAPPPAADGRVLLSQTYVRRDDPVRIDRGEPVDNIVTGPFRVNVVYECRVVATNPTSATRRLDLLLEVPSGSIPVLGALARRTEYVRIERHGTWSESYAFCFPRPGIFGHFPVHASERGVLLAAAPARELEVTDGIDAPDDASWAFVSQRADEERALRFLQEENLGRVDLARICWRLRDRVFYDRALDVLARRRVYHHEVWSYSVFHRDRERVRAYLAHEDRATGGLTIGLDSPLLQLDPVERGVYEHREYAPLVNARAHRLGARRQILNQELDARYRSFLRVVAHRPRARATDRVAAAVFLVVQDRLDDAVRQLKEVEPDQVSTRLQLDYLLAYLAFCDGDPDRAAVLAEGYLDYPVPRWRDLFREVHDQVVEVRGGDVSGAGSKAPDEGPDAAGLDRQTREAAREPALDLALEGTQVQLSFQNLSACRLSYTPLDLELLFSQRPFAKTESAQAAPIAPHRTDEVELPAGAREHTVELPEGYRSANVRVEAEAAGIRRVATSTANTLRVQRIEAFGQVRVTAREGDAPLPAVYVKVYARFQGGAVRFYKDGYTDLRGRFSYAALSTDDLDRVERFALLILSDDHGAAVLEAAPPPR